MLFETRSITVVPESLWRTTGAGAMTSSGVSITPENALNVTTVFQAIRFLSFMIGSLPLITYQKTGDDRKRAVTHRLYAILHDLPNPEMTAFDFWSLLGSHVFGRGNGLAEIALTQSGQVEALWPLNPARVEVARNENYELRYIVTLPDRFGGERRVLRPEQVLHLRGLTREGLWGLSVLSMHRSAVGLAKAQEEFSGSYFANGAEPGVVVKHPGKLSDKAFERFSETWQEAHAGLTNAHRSAILEEGMSIEKIGFNPQDSQLLESKKFQTIEIARMFGVPPHLLFELSNATFTNIEHQSLEFLIYHLRPWLVNFEQQVKRSLFLERERQAGYYSEFLVDAIERGDITSRFQAYSSGLNFGIFSINDVLRKENLNTIGEQGDRRFVPLNMAVLGADGIPIQPNPPSEPIKNPNTPARNLSADQIFGIKILLVDAAKRILLRENNELNSAKKRLDGKKERFEAWVDEFFTRDYPEFMRLVLNPFIDGNFIGAERAQDFIERFCEMRKQEIRDVTESIFDAEKIAEMLTGATHDN